MDCQLSEDGNFIEILDATEFELEAVRKSFIKKDPKYKFKKRFTPWWDGYVEFLYNDRYIPVGLYEHLRESANVNNFKLKLTNELESIFIPDKINKQDFVNFCENLMKDVKFPNGNIFEHREYQQSAARVILENKKCVAEIATSAGKTAIFYMMLSYLRKVKKINKIIVIVPNVSLVDQFISDFEVYNQNEQIDFVFQPIYGGSKNIGKRANLIVGTYQSLTKNNEEYFKQFEAVVIDEVDSSKCSSIQKILTKCGHCEYRFGMTGTLPKEGTIERMQVHTGTGPLVYTLSSDQLIKQGDATKVSIWGLRLRYLSEESLQKLQEIRDTYEGKKVLEIENKTAIKSNLRLKFICNFASKFKENSLILFHNIEYGKRILKKMKESDRQKEIYYIDGSTDKKDREYIFSQMKFGNNKILIASFGTLAVGISIPNLHYIMFTQSFKSDKIIRQSIGRGLRKRDGKDKVVIVDLVDDFEQRTKNIFLRHFEYRKSIYNNQNFPLTEKIINL